MRFMIIRKADEETEAGVLPSAELLGAMLKYNEELAKAGVMLDGVGLQASSKGSRVKFTVTIPTLVGVGGKSPAWMRHSMQALGDVLPNAQRRTLEGQTHMLKPKAIVPVLVEFFKG